MYFHNILSKYQCGFRKGLNAQHFLTKLSEKWKQSLYNGLVFGVSLTDFWKSFDCLLHELLAAKLIEYGVESSSLIIQRIQGRVLTVWVESVIYIARVLLFLHKSGLVFITITWSNEVKKKTKNKIDTLTSRGCAVKDTMERTIV